MKLVDDEFSVLDAICNARSIRGSTLVFFGCEIPTAEFVDPSEDGMDDDEYVASVRATLSSHGVSLTTFDCVVVPNDAEDWDFAIVGAEFETQYVKAVFVAA